VKAALVKKLFLVIHALSPRKHNLYKCNWWVPEALLIQNIWSRKSLTGAVDARKGYFETVNGGQLFDEIGNVGVLRKHGYYVY
jgi:transcriptional regulator with GAF, ATPase, and Fis domain